ncbi:MAG: hypothetical protein KGL39_19570 [Patescibacteria group bacterium]|nr:hypothetical protein [Patescibacteria group bacterium]
MNDFNTARQRIGGLKGLMTKLGDAPGHEHKWKSMPKCPFCGAKGKAGVFAKGGVDFFKCHASGCNSGNEVMAEIGYLAARRGLSMEKPATGGASPAYEEFLKLADCWEERPAKKSEIRSQKSEVKKPEVPAAPAPGETPATGETPVLPNPVIPPEVKPEAETPNAGQVKPGGDGGSPLPDSAQAACPAPADKPKPKSQKPEDEPPAFEEPPGRLALEKFYAQLKLSPADEKTLWEKRGLLSASCRALGFVSSPVENKDILEKLRDEFSADELLESGLFLPEDKKRKKEFRPNSQFYGMGQKGKKPKEERKHRDDRWIWGMVHPVIIPYFDEAGRLFKLRPHKGGAPASTLSGASKIYVPRDPKKAPDMVETFPRVVITEGEFKAAGLWQVLGGGRDDIEDIGHPWGVCAIPGINFGNNYDLRAELDAWLQAVQCRQVVVAFDDQDKSGRPMRERHEALIWARFLACDLARSLHIKAKVLVLPTEWRDDKGKADWDGALAGMLQGKIKV